VQSDDLWKKAEIFAVKRQSCDWPSFCVPNLRTGPGQSESEETVDMAEHTNISKLKMQV